MTRFEYDPAFEQWLGSAVREQVTEPWAKAVTARAKRYVPVDTGDLRDDIDYEIVSDFTATVGSDLDYAAATELGSRPHLIRAKDASVLANKASGEVFGVEVHHPGTSAQPYLRPAAYDRRVI